MNILLVDGNEKEASDRYAKLGMDTQFQVYEKILKNILVQLSILQQFILLFTIIIFL